MKFYIGTAGWSYKDWVPHFYPKAQTGGFDWLSYYASYFNCVEVNSTYYAYMNPAIVNAWLRKIEDVESFKFTVKLHQDFTHKRKFTQENVLGVTYNLDLLAKAERLGGLLIQFPYSFQFNQPNIEHINRLKEIFQNYKGFIEVRHASWNNKEAIEFFKGNNLTLCTIDQPQIGSSISFDPIITSNTAYIRFHGRNYQSWFANINSQEKQTYDEQSERYKYLYSPGEIVEIEQKIKEVQNRVDEIYVIMNNHPVANAVANAFELMHYLEDLKSMNIPENMLAAFPRLKQLM